MFSFTWNDLATLTTEQAEELIGEILEHTATIEEITSKYKLGDLVEFYSAGSTNDVNAFEGTLTAKTKNSFTIKRSYTLDGKNKEWEAKYEGECNTNKEFISNSASEPNFLNFTIACLFATIDTWAYAESDITFIEELQSDCSDGGIEEIKALFM